MEANIKWKNIEDRELYQGILNEHRELSKPGVPISLHHVECEGRINLSFRLGKNPFNDGPEVELFMGLLDGRPYLEIIDQEREQTIACLVLEPNGVALVPEKSSTPPKMVLTRHYFESCDDQNSVFVPTPGTE